MTQHKPRDLGRQAAAAQRGAGPPPAFCQRRLARPAFHSFRVSLLHALTAGGASRERLQGTCCCSGAMADSERPEDRPAEDQAGAEEQERPRCAHRPCRPREQAQGAAGRSRRADPALQTLQRGHRWLRQGAAPHSSRAPTAAAAAHLARRSLFSLPLHCSRGKDKEERRKRSKSRERERKRSRSKSRDRKKRSRSRERRRRCAAWLVPAWHGWQGLLCRQP